MAWSYPLTFDPQGAFLCMCSVSLNPKRGRRRSLNPLLNQGFASLCPCHDCYLDYCHDYHLKVFTRNKHWLFTLFLLFLSFQRSNRRLIVNALTGAHLSLVSEHANSVQPEAHVFVPHEPQTGGSCKCLTWNSSISCLMST